MTRVKKETLNTPLSKFAPTGIHVGAIILGPDRWREIGQWVESMQMPSEIELDDQVHNKPADESVVFENVRLDVEIVPEDSATKWHGDDDRELEKWDVPSYVKPTPERNKRTGVYNLIELNLWRLEKSPSHNPAILLNRATQHDIALFNTFHFEPHRHRRRYCRRCARRTYTQRNVAGLEEGCAGWIIDSVTQEDEEEVPGWSIEPVTQEDKIQEDELGD